MRGFAIVLAAVGMGIGLLMQTDGDVGVRFFGAFLVGNGFPTILLGLAVVALADLRKAITGKIKIDV